MIEFDHRASDSSQCSKKNIVYMYLAEKLQPDFRTISDFRKENEKLIVEVFKNTVKAAKDLGVIGLEQLSTDGSKVKASAAKVRL